MRKALDIQCKLDVLQQSTDFLLKDAKKYILSMLATTYLIRNYNNIIAYFCLSNDRITRDENLGREWVGFSEMEGLALLEKISMYF
jgi:hypothetical protein